jgi:hypothetical protein
MTRKLSISLPDDAAEVLDQVPNASAYIADAIRRLHRSDRTRAMMARHGLAITDEGVAAAATRLRAAEARRDASHRDASHRDAGRVHAGRRG